MASTGSSDLNAVGISSDGELSLNRSSSPYIRIKKTGRHYQIQTAVTTFQRKKSCDESSTSATTTVDLHAQIHFGDISYYQYFNDYHSFGSQYDNVLYELIVEDEFLAPYSSSSSSITNSASSTSQLKKMTPLLPSQGGTKEVLNPITPTPADRNTASRYGLQCQVDGIQYCQEGWIHADLTREEFLQWIHPQQPGEASNSHTSAKQPLWALASTSASFPGSEFFMALSRPPTTASATLTRRLFTHLFLPGDALSGWIRAALWLGVPTPELSIMLIDWSSLSYIGQQSRHRRPRRVDDGGGDYSKREGSEVNTNNIAPISPIAAPVLLSLLTGNWGTARRLVFGQVLVGGQSNSDTSKNGVLIDKRNERAMDVMRECLSLSLPKAATATTLNKSNKEKRIALLYGAGHCRDLHRRLVQEEGLTPIRTEWRTAFRATAPRWGDLLPTDDRSINLLSKDIASSLPPSISVSAFESVAVGFVVLPLYLLVGGLDWISTMGELGNAFEGRAYLDGVADVLLYLVRHVALYIGISKFVVDWGGNDGTIFLDDDDQLR